jgi:hypothetical protein
MKTHYTFKPINVGRWVVWTAFAIPLLVAPLIFKSGLGITVLSQMGIAIIASQIVPQPVGCIKPPCDHINSDKALLCHSAVNDVGKVICAISVDITDAKRIPLTCQAVDVSYQAVKVGNRPQPDFTILQNHARLCASECRVFGDCDNSGAGRDNIR